jgi:hypothetical protein
MPPPSAPPGGFISRQGYMDLASSLPGSVDPSPPPPPMPLPMSAPILPPVEQSPSKAPPRLPPLAGGGGNQVYPNPPMSLNGDIGWDRPLVDTEKSNTEVR